MLGLLNQVGYLTIGIGCTLLGLYFAVISIRRLWARDALPLRHTLFYVGVSANLLGEGPGKLWFTAFRWTGYPPWMVEHWFVTVTLYLTIAGIFCHVAHIWLLRKR